MKITLVCLWHRASWQFSTKVVKKNRATMTYFSLACWQPPRTKKKLLILVTLKAQLLVIAQLCCALWSDKRCAEARFVLYVELVALLNWLQRHICGGICIPQVHAEVGKLPWNKYLMKIELYNYSPKPMCTIQKCKIYDLSKLVSLPENFFSGTNG